MEKIYFKLKKLEPQDVIYLLGDDNYYYKIVMGVKETKYYPEYQYSNKIESFLYYDSFKIHEDELNDIVNVPKNINDQI